MNRRYFTASLALLTILLATAISVHAQILPPPPPEDADGVPLDPVSWVLLGAGGAAAAKKYVDKRKKNRSNTDEIS